MRNTQVSKALSPRKEDRRVITFTRMSWDASSASWNVPSIRRERLKTSSCTPASVSSRAALSPPAARWTRDSLFIFVCIVTPPMELDGPAGDL